MLHYKGGAHQQQSFGLANQTLAIWLWTLLLLAAVHEGQRVQRISLEGAIRISAPPAHTQTHHIPEAFRNSGAYLHFDDRSNINDPGA